MLNKQKRVKEKIIVDFEVVNDEGDILANDIVDLLELIEENPNYTVKYEYTCE